LAACYRKQENGHCWALLGIGVLLVPLQGLNAVRNGTIKGLGFPALAELPTQAIQPVLLLSSLAALAALDMLTVANALWAQVVVAALAVLVASVLFYRIRPKSARGQMPQFDNRNWLFTLLPLTLFGVVGTFNAQVATLLLGTLGTDEAVAGLRVAQRGAHVMYRDTVECRQTDTCTVLYGKPKPGVEVTNIIEDADCKYHQRND
jgi:O-antigen/teichoic acid export membrane protein